MFNRAWPPMQRDASDTSVRSMATTAPFHGPGIPQLDKSFVDALLATIFFRCWPTILFFAVWATWITVLNERGHSLVMQSTVSTIGGTLLGFVISYRTTISFDRYSEGRRLWSQIILGTRTFSRTVWIHASDTLPIGGQSEDDAKARSIIEKKTVINLLGAFSVAVKHYLRGEDGTDYEDLYHLVSFLPSSRYVLPRAMAGESANTEATSSKHRLSMPTAESQPVSVGPGYMTGVHQGGLPVPILMHAENPPKHRFLGMFPSSQIRRLVGKLTKARREIFLDTDTQTRVTHNLPLELTFYLSSYIALVQHRKDCDIATINTLLASLTQLVDSLTGLERVLTLPISFSYTVHLWSITILFCLSLPFQLWSTLKWITIPATVIISFIFLGFLVAGEEIENPFAYGKNNLDLDHFTNNIIRNELKAVTSSLPPDPRRWAFHRKNDRLFNGSAPITPQQWIRMGPSQMLENLAQVP